MKQSKKDQFIQQAIEFENAAIQLDKHGRYGLAAQNLFDSARELRKQVLIINEYEAALKANNT